MNENKGQKKGRISRECAYLAVFVATAISAQLCLAFLPGVELVTVLFVAYAFTFGARRGMLAGVAFSLLRQFLFGFFPNVLLLYLCYYTLLTFLFGTLGERTEPVRALWRLTALACLCTVGFSLLDSVITPVWYGYGRAAARAYFLASLPFAFSQTVCTAVTVWFLFLPLRSVFRVVKRSLLTQ